MLHRDLKSGNVMLGEHGEVLMMDWGSRALSARPEGEKLAGLRPDDLRETGSSGTPLYMLSEQAGGDALDP